MKKHLLICTALITIQACTLPEVVDRGEKCPKTGIDGSLSYINDENCTKDSCTLGDFAENFQYNVCPIEYPTCQEDTDGKFYCVKFSCNPNEHLYKGKCEPDDVDHCGSHENSCLKKGTTEAECIDAKCIATACKENYILEDDECVRSNACENPNQHFDNSTQKCEDDTVESCGYYDCSLAISGWAKGSCIDKRCIPSECQTGFHLEGENCVLDRQDACGNPPHACNANEICSEGKCNDRCGIGMVVCGQSSCIYPDSSKDFCGAKNNCQDYIPCRSNEECREGVCKSITCEDPDLTLCTINGKDECIDVNADDPEHCGSCTKNCNEQYQPNASSNTCVDGECVFECNEGYVNCGTATKPDCVKTNTVDHCGSCENKCSDDQLCENGSCTLNWCNNACKTSDNQCINSIEQCGKTCDDCLERYNASSATCTDAKCVIKKCKTNYHLSGNNCVINKDSSCAAIDSSTPVDCNTYNNAVKGSCQTDGTCKALECKANFHLEAGKCQPDTLQKCGPKLENCQTDGTKTVECKNGACVASECNANYCLSNNKCVKGDADPSTCGITGGACKSCSTKESCINGICDAPHCDENTCFHNSKTCENGTTYCGGSCTDCTTTPNASSTICQSGKCIIKSCAADYYLSENFCKPNDLQNCGGEGYDCAKNDAYWEKGTCTSGKCIPTKCKTGYHPDGQKCVADDVNNCGKVGLKCVATNALTNKCIDGVCTFTCANNFHPYEIDKSCERDDASNCGSHGYACNTNTGEKCINQTCKCTDGIYQTTIDGETVKAKCITTDQDFLAMRDAVNAKQAQSTDVYYLTRDISLKDDKAWIPVGNAEKSFISKFIGNGKTIKTGTLTCASGITQCGIFGQTSGATLSNFKLSTTISGGSENTGAVVGNITGSTAKDISVESGSVTSSATNVGGMFGSMFGSKIYTSQSKIPVTSKSTNPSAFGGGIAGMVTGTDIIDSSAIGNVTSANAKAGGIAGSLVGGNRLERCFYNGNISSSTSAGGIAAFSGSGSNINYSYSFGNIKADTYCGGLVAETSNPVFINSSATFNNLSCKDAAALVSGDASNIYTIKGNVAASTVNGSNSQSGFIGSFSKGLGSGFSLQCNIIASSLTGTGKSYALIGTLASGTPKILNNYIWEKTANATYTAYVSSATKFKFNTTNASDINISTLNATDGCSDLAWVNRKCTLINGPALGKSIEFTLPLPSQMFLPSFCK